MIDTPYADLRGRAARSAPDATPQNHVGELRALTGVRGVAAWFVVFYHIRQSLPWIPDALLDVIAKGYLAVDFFFLLSGFVIWLSWVDRLRGSGLAGIPRFLRKRIARIWPLHLLMLAVAVALASTLRETGRNDPQFVFAELPLHVLLLQNWGFTRHLDWNDPAWSISAELGAYLLFPLLVIAIDWRRVSSRAVLATAGLLLLGLHLAMRTPTLGYDIPHYGLLRCLIEFAVGTIVCALWVRWRAYPLIGTYAALATTILLACWTAGAPETLVVPAAFASGLLVLALTAERSHNPLATKLIHYLGQISFATYLSHFIMWKAFKLAFVRAPSTVPLTMIAFYLVLVLIVSAILYHGVERPAQAWLDALPLRKSKTAVPRLSRKPISPPVRRRVLPRAPR